MSLVDGRSGPSIGIGSIPPAWCSSMRPGPKPTWHHCGLSAARSTHQSQGAARPLADHDLHGRFAPRSHHRSVVHRGADQRRSLPSLHREGSGPDPAAGRHRHHGQSRLAQGQRRASRYPCCWRPAPLPTEVLARSEPDRAVLRQVQTLAPQSRTAMPSLRSSTPSHRPNTPITSPTPDMTKPKPIPL
jgi:hypothetical protein